LLSSRAIAAIRPSTVPICGYRYGFRAGRLSLRLGRVAEVPPRLDDDKLDKLWPQYRNSAYYFRICEAP
jgi:hypothetical protein